MGNIAPAFISAIRGNKVYYFKPGRFLRKIPVVNSWGLRWFQQIDLQPAQFNSLIFEINEFAIEAASELHAQIAQQNQRAMACWGKSVNNERVNLYVKKWLAMEVMPLCRAFLTLRRMAQSGHHPSEMFINDTPLNRLLIPVLTSRYPETAIRFKGLSRSLWSVLNNTFLALSLISEHFVRMAGLFWKRKLSLPREPLPRKICKEILWGLGTDRRGDDFIIDGELITPQDLLFYYRRDSTARMSNPDLLGISLANAKKIGYECVDFERTPIPVPMLWRVLLPRYIWFPISILMVALIKQPIYPSAGLLKSIVLEFLSHTAGWEAFLASYSPRMNLSLDDPYVRHNAETIILNMYGSKNVSFQWSDDTPFRDVLLAYAGFNVYFAWGRQGEKYWKGNWGMDQVVNTGYLWGHYYEESVVTQKTSRKQLIGAEHRYVLSFFDEKPDDGYVPEQTVYDFYRVATKLLEERSDVIVVVKPKRPEGFRDIPSIMELVAPQVEAGRLLIWDRGVTDVQHVIAISDVVVSLLMGVPYMEAICCGKPGFNYAPAEFYSSPIYSRALEKIIFNDVDRLVRAISRTLDHPEENPWSDLNDLIDDVDSYRDCRGIDRMRNYIHEMCT